MIEVKGAVLKLMPMAAVMVHDLIRTYVLMVSLEDSHSLRKCSAPSPSLRHSRISRGSQRGLTKVGTHQDLIPRPVADGRLGLGQDKASRLSRYELAFLKVELTYDHGIRATRRKRHEGPIPARVGALVERFVATPNPRHALFLGQCVQVQDGLPVGVCRPIGFESRTAPESLLVGLILPEVVVPLSQPADVGNLLLGVKDGQDPLERL
mmetsp:Transcript_11420/g.34472  ORF Transcript_11420/g.34472 Transcript_11420/m.34472 type:complete len:209 (+) Transcript_11420:1408-2034(+)